MRRLGLPAMLFLTALPMFAATYVALTCLGLQDLPPGLVAAGVATLSFIVEWVLGRPAAPPAPVAYSFMRGPRDSGDGAV